MKATLYTYQFVDNNLGIWCRDWAPTAEAAEKARKETIERLGVHEYVENEKVGSDCGEYGDCLTAEVVEVELTQDGLLDFAGNYAVGGMEA